MTSNEVHNLNITRNNRRNRKLKRTIKKVFMVGNSYTERNNLKHMLKLTSRRIKNKKTPLLLTKQSTWGAATLQSHAKSNVTPYLISKEEKIDYLILQEQSMFLTLYYRNKASFPYAVILRDMGLSKGARTIIYETFGYAYGDKLRFGIDDTYNQMQDRLKKGTDELVSFMNQSETELSEEMKTVKAPIGFVWREIYNFLGEDFVKLYERDGRHPSVAGSYIVDLVLYHTITGIMPKQVNYVPKKLNREFAQFLQTKSHDALVNYYS